MSYSSRSSRLGAGHRASWRCRVSAAVLFTCRMVLRRPAIQAGRAAALGAGGVSIATVEAAQCRRPGMSSPGRLEAVERVEIRSARRYAAGVVEGAVHFREARAGQKQGEGGNPLFTIDPAPYAAEVERAKAPGAGRCRPAPLALTKNDLDRGQQRRIVGRFRPAISTKRVNAQREAEANLRAAEAALTCGRSSISITPTRYKAPVAGRVGKIEITVGNLVAAGPGSPVLTSLVSINPIMRGFRPPVNVW